MPRKRKPLEKPVGQRAIEPRHFFMRFLPQWSVPQWQDSNMWRRVVRMQPICIVCRDTLISFLVGTDYHIRAKDPNQTEAFGTEIDYYMELLETSGGIDFEAKLDLLCQDLLDTPFGGCFEVGRVGDVPDGRVAWIDHIDSATLYPTHDFDFPVAQRVPQVSFPPVLFPRHAVDRIMYSPRPEWERKGWGMAPPEKVYLALDLLHRGDQYYANLLLDTPEAGVLDLMDMDKESALEWLDSFNVLFSGVDAFKVPVLYEHETAAKWIPFGRPPTDLIFDSITFKYAQIVCAGYGLRISDIGMSQEQARTLAGVIRAERQTRRTGLANLKVKVDAWVNKLLPRHLLFEFLDQDDEALMARGRARLANFQAYAEAREKKMLHLEEIRAQIASDGLLSIDIDPDNIAGLEYDPTGATAVRLPRTDDRPRVPPSAGGEGELTFPRKSSFVILSTICGDVVKRATGPRLRRLVRVIARELFPTISKAFSDFEPDDATVWAEAMVANSFGFNDTYDIGKVAERAIVKRKKSLDKHLSADYWWSIGAALPESGLEGAVAEAYLLGQSLAHEHILSLLYEEGKTDNLTELTRGELDSSEKALVHQSVVSLVDEADKVTFELLKAVVMSAVCRAFVIPTVFRTIKSGAVLEDLLLDDDFAEAVTSEVAAGVKDVFDSRVTILADQLADDIVTLSTAKFFEELGLRKEDWTREHGKLVVDRAKLLKIADKVSSKL